MNSAFYPIYQAAGWLILYIGLTAVLYMRPWFSPFEYVYGAVLLGTAAVYSHMMRLGYKRWLAARGIVWQLLYFLCQAMLGGALAGLMLFLCVWLLSTAGITDPIAAGQEAMVFKMVFWGNAFNMVAALVLWGAIYLTIIKARQLRDTHQALASSQLDALIQQLNPHFLFNVLNNIRAMILHDPAKSREALAQLADMLRYSLQRHENAKVSLEEELTIVEEYLALCKIQFEDRLNFVSEVAPEAKPLLIPRMLLQLCVENAIKHGIAKLAAGGTILLQVSKNEGCLQIVLRNPCSPVSLQSNDNDDTSTGIGLKNINHRLGLMYAKASLAQATFKRFVDSDANQEMAEIRIQLPCENREDSCE